MQDTQNTAPYARPAVAVVMTLYRTDDLGHFETALASIEGQMGDFIPRVYLCCDGPLRPQQDSWLHQNRDRFYRVIANPYNQGLARSLNRLIDILEREEFVFRMDGDDVSLPGRFAAQITFLQTHTDLSLVGCQAQDIDEQGNVIAPRSFPTNADQIAAVSHKINPVLHPSYCFRRSVFEDPAIRYPQAYLSEDLAMIVTMLERGHRIANLPDCLFQWRLGENFYTRRRDLKRGLVEAGWYYRAMRANHGVLSPQLVFPLARLLLRVLPTSWVQRAYRSPLRQRASAI
jgi:glycosyltransferase involved in cell wall biosynthesis